MDNSYGFAELHEQLLIIMDDIDRVCRAHDIKYTLSDGTLLGAVRHKGFIPWDDDADVSMVRSEFERFKAVYEKEKREDFIIGHPCNPATFSVINLNYDIPGMEKKGNSITNPWVSIFPMDNAPENKQIAWLKATENRLLSGMMGKPPQYAVFSNKSKRLWDVTNFLGRIVGHERAAKWFERSCISSSDKTSCYAFYSYNSKYCYKRYPKEWFNEIADIAFEDRTYMAITHYDEYLTNVYGDYMTPVGEEFRKAKHHSEEE